jgi:hypothetical protein
VSPCPCENSSSDVPSSCDYRWTGSDLLEDPDELPELPVNILASPAYVKPVEGRRHPDFFR